MSLFDRISGAQTGDDEEGEFGLPSYLVAADSHSIANNNQSFMEGAAETISNIPKFIGASLLSGANEIYNIAPSIGNFMGGDFDISKTADVVSSIDEDLGVYYKDHQESVDIAGFLVGSLVPGMAGVKLLNAGQKVLSTSIASGRFGKNMSDGLGLLAPSREKYLKKAIEEITNSNSLALLTNKNTMLAMASGYGQGILEAAAFEIAVASTMSASPILENQDLGDIMTNIAVGGIAFGTIVGVVDITKASFALKKAIKLADKEAAPVTNIKVPSAAIPTSSKIVYDLQQAEQLKSIDMERFPVERRQFLAQSAKTKAVALDTQVRTNLGELAGGDQVIADQAHMMTRGADLQTSMGNYLGATKISRIADLTPEEALLKRVDRKLEIGSAKIKDVEAANAVNFKASYTTSWGEGIGNTTPDLPKHITLSDTLKKSESIVIENNKLIAGKNSYVLSMKGIHDDARLGAVGTTIPAKGTGWNVKTSNVLAAQARHMLAIDSAPFVQGKTFKAVTINENDTPLLDKLYREFSPEHKVLLEDGTTRKFADASELLDFIHTKKVTLANEMVASPKFAKVSQEDIASMLNMRSSRLSGEVSPNLDRDIFALQSYADEYSKLRAAKGLPELSVPVYKLPRTLKVSYDTSVFKDLDGNLLEGIAVITQQERIHSQKIDNIFASYMADDTGNYIEIGLDKIEEASRIGSGPGLITAASENYGSLAADAEWVGKNTVGTIDKKKAVALESLSAPAWKMAQSQKATVEFSTLNARLRASPDNYILNEAGDAFELEVVANYKQMLAEGKKPKAPVLNSPDSPAVIPIENIEAREMAAAHIAVNGKRSSSLVELRTAQGVINRRNPKVFYPTPVDPKDYPFFALVVDNSITGTGHHSTIYANSNEQLEAMITKVKSTNPTFEVHTKGDAERYYKSIGQYDQSRSLNENYMDHALKRSGVSSPHFIATDPQKVTQDLIDWHMKQEASVVREFVSAKYERQFGELAKRGETFTDISTSQFNNLALVKHAENVVKNPYMDYIKTMLGIKNYSDYPFWTSANKMLDNKVSEMYDKLTKVVESSKSVEELGELNGLLRKYGYKGAAYDMEMDLLANHSASKHVLQNFVQTSNGVLATVVLRLDAFNAVTNALSANILYGAEMTSVLRAIEKGDSLAVGELAALGKIKVPGTDKLVLSPLKIYSNAIKAFGKDSPDLALFNKLNITTSISKQYRDSLDALTLRGNETDSVLMQKLESVRSGLTNLADKGERWTGNRLAEEFNRFVAAHSMKQVTDIAVKHGIMTEKTAFSYINSFVNRTQGNYLAAQRPMLFQGAIGQAVGLFQTYQFNLMQQLLRYVGEGTAKDSMTLLGLQGTIFGMNGLPAFNAINTHVVGTASGNTQHRDAYTTVYGAAGKEAGDWLMYGLASNFLLHPDLKTNLYVRGDINPRHVTIIPTNPSSVPIVQATGKFFANLFNTAGKISNGGDFATSILQGIEHNGISRPLAGLAQTLEGFANPNYASYSTSKRGNVIASNDILSLANISRMAGGKPLGEAVAIDAAFRFKAYALKDHAKREELGEAIKSTVIAGNRPTMEQIEGFAEDYAKTGGKQTEFNKWMIQLYKTTNSSQANDLRNKVSSPYAKNMQSIMGGYELKDFDN